MPNRHQRTGTTRAFTVLELLVMIAIMGAVAGLLFPAIMSAREATRRAQCSNHLRQLGVSLQNHHDALKKLPGAWSLAPDRTTGYGWTVALLSYLEESALRRNIHSTLPVTAAANDVARKTDLPILHCPSDITDPMFDLLSKSPSTSSAAQSGPTTESPQELLIELPSTNYVAVYGTMEADETYPAPRGDGPIIVDSPVRFCDLQRGQSHTILVGERTAAMVPSTWFGVHFHGEDAACRLVGSAISRPNCGTCDECEFSSRHSGGSNFVWADGHVSLVEDHIDPSEYQHLAQRHVK